METRSPATDARAEERPADSSSGGGEGAQILPTTVAPAEVASAKLPRELDATAQSASYCCEAAEVMPVGSLPEEDAFEVE